MARPAGCEQFIHTIENDWESKMTSSVYVICYSNRLQNSRFNETDYFLNQNLPIILILL